MNGRRSLAQARRDRVRNKYGAKPATDTSGTRSFQSQLERDRYEELRLLQAAGHIDGLVCQPRVELLRGIFYRVDFAYLEPTVGIPPSWRLVHEEAKGVETGRYRLLVKLWASFGPTVLRIVKRGSRGALVVTAEILPKPPVCRRCGEPWSIA